MSNIKIHATDKETGEITGTLNLEIRAYPLAEPKGRTKGFASVNIDGVFAATGISILEGKNGLFVAMPQTRDTKGEYRDIFHPVTKESREALNAAVLETFSAELDAMVVKKESTVQKMREAAAAAKEQSAPAAGKGPKDKKRSAPEH